MAAPFFKTLAHIFTLGFIHRRDTMKAIALVQIVVQAVAGLVPFASKVATGVAGDLADGNFTVDEAEARAKQLVAGPEVDLKVKFKEVDIIDDETEQLLAAAIVRIVANAAKAIAGK